MLIISQERWTTSEAVQMLAPVITAAKQEAADSVMFGDEPLLVAVPLAEANGRGPTAEKDLFKNLGALAKSHRLYLAGAAPVGAAKKVATVGFVFGPDGKNLLRVAKLSPDLVDGFSDTTAPLGLKADFPHADTPLGRIAVLPGEDILFHHYARAYAFKGAEVLINPCREKADHLVESRKRSRIARAYENLAFVVCASSSRRMRGGHEIELPAVSGMIDWMGVEQGAAKGGSLIVPDYNIDRLRARRQDLRGNFLLHLRANLYADGYKRMAKAAPKKIAAPADREGWIAEGLRRVAQQAVRNEKALAAVNGKRETAYDVLLVQSITRQTQKGTDARAIIQDNLDRAMALPARMASAPDIRLVAFGEFFLTGSGGGGVRTPETLSRIAISYPGPELDQLAEFAMRHKVYVAGSTFEKDAKLPGHIFNSAFIINDSGDLIHRYRKIQCADVWGSLPDTTPSSIYSRYLDVYGYDFLFPVVDTPLGRLATMVCFDQAHPEVSRMLAKAGAEVLIHPTSEGHGSGRKPWDISRQSRAFENAMYWLSPMPGGEYFDPKKQQDHSTYLRGHTRIVNFDGRILGEADGSGACTLLGSLDLAELRRFRANPQWNIAVWDDPAVYAHVFAERVGLPNDLWGPDPNVVPYRGMKPLKEVLAGYNKDGRFALPSARDGLALLKRKKIEDLEKMDGEFIPI